MKDKSMEFFIHGETLEEITLHQEQKLKHEAWHMVEFVNFTMGINDQSKVIKIIMNSIQRHYYDFPTVNEYFERRKRHVIKNKMDQMIEDSDQRLKFAIKEHMGFLYEFLEVNDYDTITTTIDTLVLTTIREYYVWENRFDVNG